MFTNNQEKGTIKKVSYWSGTGGNAWRNGNSLLGALKNKKERNWLIKSILICDESFYSKTNYPAIGGNLEYMRLKFDDYEPGSNVQSQHTLLKYGNESRYLVCSPSQNLGKDIWFKPGKDICDTFSDEKNLYIASKKNVCSVSIQTGKVNWVYNNGSQIILVLKNNIFCFDKSIKILDLSGKLQTEIKIPENMGVIDTISAVGGNHIAFYSSNQPVHILEISSGRISLGLGISSLCMVGNYEDSLYTYVLNRDYKGWKCSDINGKEKWSFKTLSPDITLLPPLVSGRGEVFFYRLELFGPNHFITWLYRLNPSTGKIEQKIRIGDIGVNRLFETAYRPGIIFNNHILGFGHFIYDIDIEKERVEYMIDSTVKTL
jgi:hypothetical protein